MADARDGLRMALKGEPSGTRRGFCLWFPEHTKALGDAQGLCREMFGQEMSLTWAQKMPAGSTGYYLNGRYP